MLLGGIDWRMPQRTDVPQLAGYSPPHALDAPGLRCPTNGRHLSNAEQRILLPAPKPPQGIDELRRVIEAGNAKVALLKLKIDKLTLQLMRPTRAQFGASCTSR